MIIYKILTKLLIPWQQNSKISQNLSNSRITNFQKLAGNFEIDMKRLLIIRKNRETYMSFPFPRQFASRNQRGTGSTRRNGAWKNVRFQNRLSSDPARALISNGVRQKNDY